MELKSGGPPNPEKGKAAGISVTIVTANACLPVQMYNYNLTLIVSVRALSAGSTIQRCLRSIQAPEQKFCNNLSSLKKTQISDPSLHIEIRRSLNESVTILFHSTISPY